MKLQPEMQFLDYCMEVETTMVLNRVWESTQNILRKIHGYSDANEKRDVARPKKIFQDFSLFFSTMGKFRVYMPIEDPIPYFAIMGAM